MGRFRGPVVKLARALGINVAETDKVQKYMERRPYGPGQHGQRRKGRPSDYSIRLREKQKLRMIYNVSERQFRNLFAEAARRQGVTGTVFLQLLESRLDNLVFRLGLAATRRQARQMVGHGHICLNGQRVDIPSIQVKPGDVISVHESAKKLTLVLENVEQQKRRKGMSWIVLNTDTLEGKYERLPAREDLSLPVNEQFIVEYYSR